MGDKEGVRKEFIHKGGRPQLAWRLNNDVKNGRQYIFGMPLILFNYYTDSSWLFQILQFVCLAKEHI